MECLNVRVRPREYHVKGCDTCDYPKALRRRVSLAIALRYGLVWSLAYGALLEERVLHGIQGRAELETAADTTAHCAPSVRSRCCSGSSDMGWILCTQQAKVPVEPVPCTRWRVEAFLRGRSRLSNRERDGEVCLFTAQRRRSNCGNGWMRVYD